jgi:hypothetical protein
MEAMSYGRVSTEEQVKEGCPSLPKRWGCW